MNPVLADLGVLFDTSDFPARWNCGRWTLLHGWSHIISDIAIAGAYSAIPFALAGYWWLKRSELAFPRLFWLFAAFIFSCGATHLVEATIFYHPIYRFSALMKAVTAVVSWATVIALFRVAPKALELPGLQRANSRLQEQLARTRRAEEALERSNRDLESFTGLVTHDLRNPLNSAMFMTEIAREAAERNEPQFVVSQLRLASESLRQMEALIRELHADALVRSRVGDMTEVPLEAVVESARLNLASLIASTRARIVAQDLPSVIGSRTMLVQLFINLFENSIKYRNENDPLIELEAICEGDRKIVRVRDNGVGIPGNQTEAIFARGQRGDNAIDIPGSGLGLDFCRRIMEAHGGTITASSAGHGAEFELNFPVSPVSFDPEK